MCVGVVRLVLILLCNSILSVLVFPIISLGKKELVAFLWLSSYCYVAVSVLCLFLAVRWVGLQCVTVAYPRHTHSHFGGKRGL